MSSVPVATVRYTDTGFPTPPQPDNLWRGAPTGILTNASRLVVSDFYLTNALLHAASVHPLAMIPSSSRTTRALSRELAMSIIVVFGNDSVKASKP